MTPHQQEKRRNKQGSGKLAQKVASSLECLLHERYPGISIFPERDLWFQSGDYRKQTWDLARWGAHILYQTNDTVVSVNVHSWDTMRDCQKFGLAFVKGREYAHEFEVCANEPDLQSEKERKLDI